MGPRYGVMMTFSTKRAALKKAKESRKAGYGARVTKIGREWIVRRTDYPLKRRPSVL